jgi:hypothetical protein
MATSFTWDCRTVDVRPTQEGQTDVVYNVHWRLTGTSDQLDSRGNAYSATIIGTQIIDTSDLSNFTPIADVTNEEVTGWVEASMGEDGVTAKKDSIQASIDLLITPISITMQIGGDE